MSALDPFAESYGQARAMFIEAAQAAGATLESHRHPLSSADGEALTIDVARIGAATCDRLLVVTSGTHGVEGFCGAAIQSAWLTGGRHRDRPDGVAVVLVHGLNPHGFSGLRRSNEDNVDLNRNFIDFTGPRPENPGYDRLATALCPTRIDDASLTQAQSRLENFEQSEGSEALFTAIVQGQYRHPRGLFYGGTGPAWSNRAFRQILACHSAGVRHLAYLDIHTGYGPRGQATVMSGHAETSAPLGRLRDWLGSEVAALGDLSSGFVDNFGDTSQAVLALNQEIVPAVACLEFGTHPERDVLIALRRENWLRFHGPGEGALAAEIRADLREAFYPRAADWRRMVLDQADALIDRVQSGLSQGDYY